jgi:3-oxoacyl-[acyl-carrier protein] reductase
LSPAGETFEADVAKAGGIGAFASVDVSKADAVDAAVADVVARWGRVDVLVNNAGIVRDAQLVKVSDGAVVGTMTNEAWDAVIGVNLRGPFLCTRAVAPRMIRQSAGCVLTTSSVVGRYGNFGQTNYAATKAGVVAMTQTWARELGRYGIRVNAVAPGFIATDIVKSMPQKVLDGMVGRTPLGRLGQPDDVANVFAWLASDQAAFVHGATISVDGGLVLGT